MHKKNILPMAAIALVVVLGFEKYRAGALKAPHVKIGA